VRNRPSFEVALVPEDLPFDDPDTEEVDEEAIEVEKVLRILRADSDRDVALRMAEILFIKLGYNDFRANGAEGLMFRSPFWMNRRSSPR
jgi:hypothetical protein